MPQRIAITMGDPNGIGPEIVLKLLELRRNDPRLTFVVVGVRSVFDRHAGATGVSLDDLPHVLVETDSRHSVDFGALSPSAGRCAMQAVTRAIDLCIEGEVDAMVTAPISKEAISMAGFDVPGHTEYIADRTGGNGLMVMVAPDLRVALLTGHMPLERVAGSIDESKIVERTKLLDDCLRLDFGVEHPRVALLGLNPHAGDGGVLGSEERRIYQPAVARLHSDGVDVSDPLPADGFFGRRQYLDFDGVLASYHDQGLAPFKALSFGRGVNFTAGLSIVRTSPDHGTAFAIAGKGTASPSSLGAASDLAAFVAHRRSR